MAEQKERWAPRAWLVDGLLIAAVALLAAGSHVEGSAVACVGVIAAWRENKVSGR